MKKKHNWMGSSPMHLGKTEENPDGHFSNAAYPLEVKPKEKSERQIILDDYRSNYITKEEMIEQLAALKQPSPDKQ